MYILCNIVTMECSTEVVVFACAYKREMRFKMAGKFKTTTTSHRITDIMHSQSKYIPGVKDEYNAPRHVQMPPCVISLRSPAQNSRVRWL